MAHPSRSIYVYRWLMWNIFSRLFVRFYLRPRYRFRRSPDSDSFPRPPFIVIANHGTFFDPWIAGSFSPYPFALMCNDDAFRGSPITRWYLKSIGAFPKKKGASDFKAMKTTLGLLSSGFAVCIFPEGQTTWDGETQLLYKGIERIIKRANCPLVAIRFQGNFLTRPWWAHSIRKGRILANIRVLQPDRIQTMTPDDLFDYMRTSIQQNDVTDPANLAAPFTGARLAEGVERQLWLCPHCRAEDRLVASGNSVRCDGCFRSWTMDAWCRFRPDQDDTAAQPDLYAWSRWQGGQVIDKLRSAETGAVLTENSGVTLQTEDDGGDFVDRATGTLRLTPEELRFDPASGAQPHVRIPVAELFSWVIQRKDILECAWEGTDYRFLLNHKSPMKWIYHLRYLKGFEKLEAQGWLE